MRLIGSTLHLLLLLHPSHPVFTCCAVYGRYSMYQGVSSHDEAGPGESCSGTPLLRGSSQAAAFQSCLSVLTLFFFIALLVLNLYIEHSHQDEHSQKLKTNNKELLHIQANSWETKSDNR